MSGGERSRVMKSVPDARLRPSEINLTSPNCGDASAIVGQYDTAPDDTITIDNVKNLVGKINELDLILKTRFGLSVLSSEGAVLCSLIGNNGSMTKMITANANYSERTAFAVIRKLENLGLIKKTTRQTDARRSAVELRVCSIVTLMNKNPERSGG